MARTVIPTNFQDDELAEEMQGRRRYRQILNLDGTVSFEDETDYDTEGSTFGASRVNEMAQNINESADVNKIIDDLEDIAVVTQNGFMAGAKAVKELNSNLTANSQPFRFGYQDGKYGYIVESEGADTFNPFKQGELHYYIGSGQPNSITIEDDCTTVILCYDGTDYTTGKSLTSNGVTVPWIANSYVGESFNAHTQGYTIWTGDFKANETIVRLTNGASNNRGFLLIWC